MSNNVSSPMVLRAERLEKRYHGRPVLRDVSLEVPCGEIVGLLGPNGSGKTTCFYIMSGLLAPDKGTVWLNGRDVTSLPIHQRALLGIGYLPQESSIFRGMTVEENILAALEIVEPRTEKREARVEHLLGEFGISYLRHSSALALSGGERRRVEIARCLALSPSFVLLDEPLAGIDPIAIADLKQLILDLKKRHIGVLITDHNVRETLSLVDRAYILYDGMVMMEGEPEFVQRHPDVRRVYLGASMEDR
jgi:lipopolysaccharide export system ATP-binding protein